MKIEFDKIRFRPSLFEPEAPMKDIHRQIANAIWQGSRDIAAGKFALELFDNPDIEVSEQEKDYIKDALENFAQWARTPILEALNEE